MRRCVLLLAGLLLGLPGAGAAATTSGGTPAPGTGGGTIYGQPVKPSGRLVATAFAPSTPVLVAGGPPLEFSYRIDGPREQVRARIELLRAGERRAVVKLDLGRVGTRRKLTRLWVPPALPAGEYVARLHAVGADGRGLKRSARATGRTTFTVEPAPPAVAIVGEGVFPVAGAWSFGGEDAVFGAERPGHIHQGQDIVAAEGTPLVTPRAGTVLWRAYQSGGAGHYLVVHGDDGRDYAFMHLQSGSPTVGKGDAVTAGQVIAAVGSTGRSDGAHLHFEIWVGGWYQDGGAPIDPRPDLEAWAAQSGA